MGYLYWETISLSGSVMGFLGRLEVVETRYMGVVGTDKGDIRVNTCRYHRPFEVESSSFF